MDVRLNTDAVVQRVKPISLCGSVALNEPATVLPASTTLRARFERIRGFSLALVEGLSDAGETGATGMHENEIREALDRHWADGRPSYSVRIMAFLAGKVARETQYFGDPFQPGPSRAHLVERMD
jgi:hypothetical protein